MFKKITLYLIKIYQKYLSLDQGFFSFLGIKVCRFTPTCSCYTYDAIDKYGIFKGSIMGLWRIIRCNPFNAGGHDPVK